MSRAGGKVPFDVDRFTGGQFFNRRIGGVKEEVTVQKQSKGLSRAALKKKKQKGGNAPSAKRFDDDNLSIESDDAPLRGRKPPPQSQTQSKPKRNLGKPPKAGSKKQQKVATQKTATRTPTASQPIIAPAVAAAAPTRVHELPPPGQPDRWAQLSNVPLASVKALHNELRGFISATPWQLATHAQLLSLPPILAGRDVCLQAPTGSGKTVAFLVPIVEAAIRARLRHGVVDASARLGTRCIIAAPTFELARQTFTVLSTLCGGDGAKRKGRTPLGPWIQLVCAGQRIKSERALLIDAPPDIVVGTPGRLADHLTTTQAWRWRTTLRSLVLDEADRAMSREGGCPDDTRAVLSAVRDGAVVRPQVVLVSATASGAAQLGDYVRTAPAGGFIDVDRLVANTRAKAAGHPVELRSMPPFYATVDEAAAAVAALEPAAVSTVADDPIAAVSAGLVGAAPTTGASQMSAVMWDDDDDGDMGTGAARVGGISVGLAGHGADPLAGRSLRLSAAVAAATASATATAVLPELPPLLPGTEDLFADGGHAMRSSSATGGAAGALLSRVRFPASSLLEQYHVTVPIADRTHALVALLRALWAAVDAANAAAAGAPAGAAPPSAVPTNGPATAAAATAGKVAKATKGAALAAVAPPVAVAKAGKKGSAAAPAAAAAAAPAAAAAVKGKANKAATTAAASAKAPPTAVDDDVASARRAKLAALLAADPALAAAVKANPKLLEVAIALGPLRHSKGSASASASAAGAGAGAGAGGRSGPSVRRAPADVPSEPSTDNDDDDGASDGAEEDYDDVMDEDDEDAMAMLADVGGLPMPEAEDDAGDDADDDDHDDGDEEDGDGDDDDGEGDILSSDDDAVLSSDGDDGCDGPTKRPRGAAAADGARPKRARRDAAAFDDADVPVPAHVLAAGARTVADVAASVAPGAQPKLIIFFATCAAVRFFSTALAHLSARGVLPPSLDLWALHGQMKPRQRAQTYQEFEESPGGVLLATNVAARGLDFPFVSTVVQFDPPDSVEEYCHRIGRTARGGRIGSAVLFLLPQEVMFLDHLQANTGLLPPAVALPESKALAKVDGILHSALLGDARLELTATRAYRAYVQWYNMHTMRDCFHVARLDLHAVARPFGLKQAPALDRHLFGTDQKTYTKGAVRSMYKKQQQAAAAIEDTKERRQWTRGGRFVGLQRDILMRVGTSQLSVPLSAI